MATAARRLALRILEEVGARGGPLLAERLAEPDVGALAPRDRAFLHELVLGTLRRRGALDHALAGLLDQPFARLAPPAREVLRLGAYQVLHLRVPDRAAVSESVDLARAACPRQAGLVNAVLRRLARAGPPPLPDPAREPERWLVTEGSLPAWLAERWLRSLGPAGAVARARAFLEPAPVAFRFNPRRPDAAEVARVAGLAWEPLALPEACRATAGAPATLVAEGWLYVQDQGSQLVARLAGGGGIRLDACAAPGSKTTLLADLAGDRGRVVAADVSRRRLRSLGEAVARWGCGNVSLLAADGRQPPFRAETLDAVLLDAPCSGLGTLGRHPDIRWRARAEDIAGHAGRQAELLRALAPLVRPGGALVYAVCSGEPEEGEAVADAFRAEHPRWRPAELPAWSAPFHGPGPGRVATRPEEHGGDAFFAAVLTRP
jgi:16S rRNA (cytosine967-C5)-methyltransferase